MEQNKYYMIALTEEQRHRIVEFIDIAINRASFFDLGGDLERALGEIKKKVIAAEPQEVTTENPFAWHSVKDRLPTITDGESANVLAVDEYGNQGVAWLEQLSNGATDWWSCDDRLEKHAITAWQEIEQYKAEEGKE